MVYSRGGPGFGVPRLVFWDSEFWGAMRPARLLRFDIAGVFDIPTRCGYRWRNVATMPGVE